jgi:anti-sigma factor RsiW
MDCELVQTVLPGYIDDDLTEEAAQLVKKHLSDCPRCAQEVRNIRRAADALRLSIAPTRPCEQFRERLLSRLLTAHRRRQRALRSGRAREAQGRPVLWDLNRTEAANG